MFNPKQLRNNSDAIRKSLQNRGFDTKPLEDALEIDRERREVIEEVEELRHKRNTESERIGELKQQGKDDEADELIHEMSDLKNRIERLSEKRNSLDDSLHEILLEFPNILRDDVPAGEDESDNRLEERNGKKPNFSFDPKPHWELAEQHDLINFEQAQKISGARFSVLHGLGAKLERALISLMLDIQTTENGYEETMTPVLVRKQSMQGTGQLPKFERDMYKTEKDGQYLIPTSEVSLINLYREQILEANQLPIKKTACTPCFRREAGAHGRDTRGLIRQHQFNKIELVQIRKPDKSYEALTGLLEDAKGILERLELPYRVVTLCSGDTGFAAAKTFDLEVWLPSQERYREISSCSNCEGFQARRAQIQYRPDPDSSADYCHTLNGSGLAVGRCWLAILENYQQKDGTITVPDALRPYLDGRKTIS